MVTLFDCFWAKGRAAQTGIVSIVSYISLCSTKNKTHTPTGAFLRTQNFNRESGLSQAIGWFPVFFQLQYQLNSSFHLLKNMLCFPLLVVKGNYHCWTYFCFPRAFWLCDCAQWLFDAAIYCGEGERRRRPQKQRVSVSVGGPVFLFCLIPCWCLRPTITTGPFFLGSLSQPKVPGVSMTLEKWSVMTAFFWVTTIYFF